MRRVYSIVALIGATLGALVYLVELRQKCGSTPYLRCIGQAVGVAGAPAARPASPVPAANRMPTASIPAPTQAPQRVCTVFNGKQFCE